MEQSPNIAQRVIEICGGHGAVSAMTGASITRVYRWTYPVNRGGTGGLIPTKHQGRLLEEARKRGIALNPNDFFGMPSERGA